MTYCQHVISSLVASTASYGSTAVQNFAVQRVILDFSICLIRATDLQLQLYYNTNVNATTAVLATFSTACFGYVINFMVILIVDSSLTEN